MAEQLKTTPGRQREEADDGDRDIPEFRRTPGKAEGEDPANPDSKPQGTLEDQEKNMDSEGHPVEPPPAEAG